MNICLGWTGPDAALCYDPAPNFVLPVPPIESQRAIAHILGTLHDKIDLNRRMGSHGCRGRPSYGLTFTRVARSRGFEYVFKAAALTHRSNGVSIFLFSATFG